MEEQLKNHLLAVAKTLDEIEVKGKSNISKLLASINHLEAMANGELGEYVRKDESES